MQKIGDVAGSNADPSGEWTPGDPQSGTPATILMADYLNTLQRELVAIAEHNGGALNPGDDAQLINAIRVVGQPAGSVWLMGQMSKGAGDTLNLPEGQANIGGNGLGYLLSAETDWDPTLAANQDGGVGALALGDNVYIYAVQQASGIAKWIASKNSSVPTGYTSANSRKIGGFHYGRVRPVANRYDTAYAPAVQIVPNSVWDLQHRPTCDPTGMVEVVPGKLWVDIYLASEGSGTWPENIPVSRYGVPPIKDDIYARSDFHLLARNAGKRLPTVEEFLTYAEGAPQGNDGNNDTAWSATTNTGPSNTGTVAKAVSMFNVVDAAGNLCEWLDDHYDLGLESRNAWTADIVDVGKDAAFARGQAYTYVYGASDTSSWRGFVGGGQFDDGVRCGSRRLGSDAHPWDAHGVVGLRCVCDAL